LHKPQHRSRCEICRALIRLLGFDAYDLYLRAFAEFRRYTEEGIQGGASFAPNRNSLPNRRLRLSNGKQSGPRIGIEKGPLTGGGAGLSR
jgi:hypothetical protein